MRDFERRVAASGIRRILWLDLTLGEEPGGDKLDGCGMVVVNPPYGFAEEAASLLDWLKRALAPKGKGVAHCRVLVGE